MAEISVQTTNGKRERFALGKVRVTIGRSRECDFFLPVQWLSRQHAEIRQRDDGFYLVDLGSKNGTLLNGEPIKEQRRLREGDVITLGEHNLTFSGESLQEDDDEVEPEGTRVFSARELSDISTKPAIDPAELQRQNRILATVSKAASELVIHRPLTELFELLLDLLFQAVPAERGAILLHEGDPPLPVIKASRTRQGETVTRVSRSNARRVLADRVSLLLPNLLEDARFKGEHSILATGIRSAMCAPLWFSATGGERDQVIGLVYLDTRQRTAQFGEEDLKVLTALANVAAAKIENVRLLEESLEKRRLEEDMRMAAEIQKGLQPKTAPAVPGYGLTGCNISCRTVGGDYIDYELEEGRLLLALGDVAGKGTGAALLMTVLRAAVRGLWTQPVLAEGVARINRTVCQNIPSNKYVTFFMARLAPPTGRLEYVNAGHNPPLLIRSGGEVERLEVGGMVLGLFDTVPYETGSAELRPGDTLLIYSDGVTETWSEAEEEFGETGLAEVAVRGRGLAADTLQEEILKALDTCASGARATDDRSLIVLKRY